jgi:hypothetical protein
MWAAAQRQKIRRIVWTGAVAAVTATGAWYGAGLKTKSEIKHVWANLFSSFLPPTGINQLTGKMTQVVQKQHEATPAEKIARLEEQRGALVAKRMGLERKIKELEMRASGATRAESMVGQERKR